MFRLVTQNQKHHEAHVHNADRSRPRATTASPIDDAVVANITRQSRRNKRGDDIVHDRNDGPPSHDHGFRDQVSIDPFLDENHDADIGMNNNTDPDDAEHASSRDDETPPPVEWIKRAR